MRLSRQRTLRLLATGFYIAAGCVAGRAMVPLLDYAIIVALIVVGTTVWNFSKDGD